MTNNNVTFTYLEVSRVSALLPKTGSINGGTTVTVVYAQDFRRRVQNVTLEITQHQHLFTIARCCSALLLPVQYILVVLFPLALAMLLKRI